MTTIESPAFYEPGRGAGLLDVVRRWYLLTLLVRKELRVRYRGSFLGLLWSYVKPAVQFAVFYFAIGMFLGMNNQVENFAIYLFSGIVVVNFFSEAFGNETRSIVANTPLVKKIYLPRELFPVASIWVAFVHFLPQLAVLLVGTFVVGWRPRLVDIAAVLLGLLIISCLALGLGLLFSAFNVIFRDAENFVELTLMCATWLSPVLYRHSQVVDVFGDGFLWRLYLANPVTSTVLLFHQGFWLPTTTGRSGDVPVTGDLIWSAGAGLVIAVASVVVGQYVFSRLDGRFAQEL